MRRACNEIAATSRSEAQFRLLVRGVTDYAIYLLDPDGVVSSWNLGAQRIKGYAPEEIIGQHFSQFYTEEDRASGAPERGLDTARREGRFETEGWRVRKDGTRFRAHAIIDAIPGEDGEVIGFAKITRDITEREEARRALERTREALYQSQKLEAIGRLTGGVAHDFNNLLMAVLGSLELARKRLPDDPQINRLIGNAIQGAQRGAMLTQRMLTFARRQELETGANRSRGAGPEHGAAAGSIPWTVVHSAHGICAASSRRGNGSRSARIGIDERRHQCARCDASRRNDHLDRGAKERGPRRRGLGRRASMSA